MLSKYIFYYLSMKILISDKIYTEFRLDLGLNVAYDLILNKLSLHYILL